MIVRLRHKIIIGKHLQENTLSKQKNYWVN